MITKTKQNDQPFINAWKLEKCALHKKKLCTDQPYEKCLKSKEYMKTSTQKDIVEARAKAIRELCKRVQRSSKAKRQTNNNNYKKNVDR